MDSLLKEVRSLEKKALELGLIKDFEIKSLSDMKYEAFECYLIGKIEFLEREIKDSELENGGLI